MDLVAELGLGRFMFTQWASNTLRYFLVAGFGWMTIRYFFKNYLAARRHSPRPVSNKDIRREIVHSLQSGLIFLVPTLLLVTLGSKAGFTNIYWDFKEHSVTWYLASFVILFFWHDTYFYWTHRLMHHPKLYKKFHHVHHQSVYPTPWAALSFNWTEAIVESLVFIIAVIVLPLHWSVPPLFNLFSILMNVHGHLGHDIFSRETLEKAPFKWFNHPSTHGQHHLKHRGNYSLYLVFWDKLMGTYIGHISPSVGLTSDHKSPNAHQDQTHGKLDSDMGSRTSPQESEAQSEHASAQNLSAGPDHAA